MDLTNKIYVRILDGFWRKIRRNVNLFLIISFIALPWINYDGRQAIYFNLSQQKFHLFSLVIWPQDLIVLALSFMLAAFALLFVTTF